MAAKVYLRNVSYDATPQERWTAFKNMLMAFNKAVDESGIKKELKRREFYESPGEKKRRKRKEAANERWKAKLRETFPERKKKKEKLKKEDDTNGQQKT
jgi:ribosomal protein S21